MRRCWRRWSATAPATPGSTISVVVPIKRCSRSPDSDASRPASLFCWTGYNTETSSREPRGRTMRALFHLILAMAAFPFAAAPQARAQDAADPARYVVSYIEVAPAMKEATASLLRQFADTSRKEAGAMLSEVLDRTSPSNEFL